MNIYVLCFTRTSVAEEPRLFAAALRRHLPGAAPAEFYKFENVKTEFSEANDETFSSLWRSGSLFWSRKKPKVYGSVRLGNVARHTDILHTFDSKAANSDEIFDFVATIGRNLQADYVLAHPIPNKDVSPEDTQIGSHVARLQPNGLPGVPWLAYYGPPYTELIGTEALLSLPHVAAVSGGENAVLCRVTDPIDHVWKNRGTFAAKRDAIAQAMGDVFYTTQTGCAPRVPVFSDPIVTR